MEDGFAFEAHREADIGDAIAAREQHFACRLHALAPQPPSRRHMRMIAQQFA